MTFTATLAIDPDSRILCLTAQARHQRIPGVEANAVSDFREPDMSLNGFFSRYAELSLGPQPEELAGVYAPTFIVGGPSGSQAFANDVRFVEWLRQVADFNRQHGMRTLTATSIRDATLSPIHTLATVT